TSSGTKRKGARATPKTETNPKTETRTTLTPNTPAFSVRFPSAKSAKQQQQEEEQ
ncbi:hypothetical protein BGZ95_006875, partial [Linnemannia exigua]